MSFIKFTDHRPTGHRPLVHRPTDYGPTNSPTYWQNTIEDLIIEKYSFYRIHTAVR